MLPNDNQSKNEPTQYTVREKAREEGWKLHYDTFKHLTTLNTGSILILVTFLEKLFTKPVWKELVAVAFGFFVLSIIISLLAMISIASSIRDMGGFAELEKKYDMGVVVSGVTLFTLGIICLIVFGIKNLYS